MLLTGQLNIMGIFEVQINFKKYFKFIQLSFRIKS